ncbi:MAG: hypothetical protein ACFFF4_09950 [Candidatus Thorarchaeota archaeon]
MKFVGTWKAVSNDANWFNCIDCGTKVIPNDWIPKIQWRLREYHRCIDCIENNLGMTHIRRGWGG